MYLPTLRRTLIAAAMAAAAITLPAASAGAHETSGPTAPTGAARLAAWNPLVHCPVAGS